MSPPADRRVRRQVKRSIGLLGIGLIDRVRTQRSLFPPNRAADVRAVFPLLAAFGLSVGRVAAQDALQRPTPLGDGAPCAQCSVELRTVVTLGGDDGPGVETISRFSPVAMDARGQIWIASGLPGSDHMAVFDTLGHFLRGVGRRGEGPGEYQLIRHIASTARLVHVFDDRALRRTVLDEGYQVVRTTPVPGHVRATVALDSVTLLAAATIPTPLGVGHPLHVLDPMGTVESFGYTGGKVRGGMPTQFVGHGLRGAVWTVRSDAFEVTHWDLAKLEPLARYQRRAPWFDDDDFPANPRSVLLGIHQGPDGLLWIVGEAPDERWTERVPWTASRPYPSEPAQEVFDGIIEVFDVDTATLMATVRTDAVMMGFIGGGEFIALYREDTFGVPFIDVAQLRLLRAHQTPKPGGVTQ